MNKYDSDLKTQFSAYVKQSVLNAKRTPPEEKNAGLNV